MQRLILLLLIFTSYISANKINIDDFIKNNSSVIILINPKNGEIIKANSTASSFYGYKLKKLENMNIKDINTFTKKQVQEEMQRAKKEKRNHFIFKHKLKDNSIKEVVVHSYPVIYNNKKILLSIIHELANKSLLDEFNKNLNEQVELQTKEIQESKDKALIIFLISSIILIFTISYLFYLLSQRKKLMDQLVTSIKSLNEQKEELSTIVETSIDGIALLDLESNFLKFNNAYLKATGFSKAELLTKSCIELTVPEEREKAVEAINIVLEKGHIENFEKKCMIKNGKTITVNMSIALMPDKKSLLVVMKDVSKLKLIDTQTKLVSMGEMIGNIAHQWRQPLNMISTSASSLELKSQLKILNEDDIVTTVESIIQQTQYLSQTIDDFRTFIKEDEHKENLSLINSIKKTLTLLESSFKNNYINIITNFEEDIKIQGYENQLVQAFINILNNSKDALKENIDENKRYIFIETKKEDEKLILIIKDNAKGIKEETLPRIFEPYFTTKHQNVGTGIGLSLANDILSKHHNATITVNNEEFLYENQKQKGACFKIEFKM